MKSNLYTRTGDSGSTSLVDGSRTGKDSLRLESYGTVDELSSVLGLVAARPECPEEIRDQLRIIQHSLFDIGANLATPPTPSGEFVTVAVDEEMAQLEGWIDSLDERTPKMKSFILPGGSVVSSECHVARTVCRRAERNIIALSRDEAVDPQIVAYINRLSDYLFIAARYLNFIQGISDIAWQQRKKG